MSEKSVTVRRDPSGATCLLLNRVRTRNAIDEPTAQAVLAELDRDHDTPVLLGSTDPTVFCAGVDLNVPDDERARCSDLLYACYERLIHRPGVVIAVVEGPAVGGGAQLSTAADLRIAGRGARWRWVGPGHGVAVGAWILPSLVGRGAALELALSGRWVDAARACEIGLISAVHDDPWPVAQQLAEHIAVLDPAAVTRVKAIATMGELPNRLTAERQRNHTSWTGTVG